MTLFRLCRRTLPLAAALLLLAGCDHGPTEPGVDELVIMETILVGDEGDVAFSHIDHWHGAPVVWQGGTAGYTLNFTSILMPPDDHDAPPVEQWFTLADHPEYDLRVVIQDTTLARWTGDSVRGTLHGLRAGASIISFVVRRGTTTIYEAPPLNFRVREPE
jgi:hypothetical protein